MPDLKSPPETVSKSQSPTPAGAPGPRPEEIMVGKVIKWVALGVMVIVVGGLGIMFSSNSLFSKSGPEPDVADTPGVETPQVKDMPTVHFTDITSEAGIDFVHFNSATGEKLLPETMGGGSAFFDYDNDGDQDLLMVNSGVWPHLDPVTPAPIMAMYRNDGTGHFDNVTTEVGLDVSFYGMGAAVADYDADGDTDLFISAVGQQHLFRNDGGTFTDVSVESGIADAANALCTSSGFLDYDNDGDLDLFVCNYVKWSREINLELKVVLKGVGAAYGPPQYFEGADSFLFRNEGDGRFTEVGEEAGLHVHMPEGPPVGKSLAITFADVDSDGWIDIFVANDTTRNFLFINKEGRFTEIGEQSGVAYDTQGSPTSGMGIDVGYFLNDDGLAVAIGNFSDEASSFFVAHDRSFVFTDENLGVGIGSMTRSALTFGVLFFDYDLDGWLDYIQANGHLEEKINIVQPSQQYRQSAQLFWNAGVEGPRPLVIVPSDTVGDLSEPMVGRGVSYADIDGDGDLDILLTQPGGRPLLVRNDQALGHHWLRVKLVGTTANRDAIGAWIELTAAGETQRRQVMPTRSYIAQVELPVTFGLGRTATVDSMRVFWPNGTTQDVEVTGVDRTIVVTQDGN